MAQSLFLAHQIQTVHTIDTHVLKMLENLIATESWSSSSWYAIRASRSCCGIFHLQITASCLDWLHSLHSALGLLRSSKWGWPFPPQYWHRENFPFLLPPLQLFLLAVASLKFSYLSFSHLCHHFHAWLAMFLQQRHLISWLVFIHGQFCQSNL